MVSFAISSKIRGFQFSDNSNFFAYLTKDGLSIAQKSTKYTPRPFQLPDQRNKKYNNIGIHGSTILVLSDDGLMLEIDSQGNLCQNFQVVE